MRKNKVKPPEFYEAAGNRFAILLYTNLNTQDNVISSQAARVFSENPDNIDTVLVLVALGDQSFRYLVIERDGSWSEMCGNGARAAAKYLYDSGLAEPNQNQPITLITKSNKQIIVQAVERDGETWYQVDMGKVTSVTEDPNSFQGLLGEGFDGDLEKFGLGVDGNLEKSGLEKLISRELKKYLENPNLLRELFPNVKKDDEPKEDGEQKKDGEPNPLSIYSHYFHEILHRDNGESKFKEFVQALKYRGLYQAGGEPHTLIEITNPEIETSLGDVRFSVYLKVVSFLLRHAQDQQGKRLYPQSMNFMFYLVKSESREASNEKAADELTVNNSSNNYKVYMYPSERGVHNEINYDHTGACGTGSCCLGNHLLKHLKRDPRFKNLNEITIINRSGIPLIVALDDRGNTQLIGQAERTKRFKVDKGATLLLPLVVRIFLERFYHFNPEGERRLDELAERARQSNNPIIQLFSTIRQMFRENDTMLAPTSIDHPNPRGFWDFYTIVGYPMSAYIAVQLKLKLAPISLNTTGIEGNDFPAEFNFPALGEVYAKFQQALAETLVSIDQDLGSTEQTTIDKNKSPYQLLIEHLQRLIVANKLTFFLDAFLEKFTNLEGTDYRSKIADLVFHLIQTGDANTDEIQTDDADEIQTNNTNKNVSVRECLILQALLNSILDLQQILKELNKKVPEELLTNIFQTKLKGRLIDAIYPWILDPEQIQVLQAAGLLNPKADYLIPRIFTSGITEDGFFIAEEFAQVIAEESGQVVDIAEKFKQAIALILEADSNLLVEYINFYLKNKHGSKITLAQVNGKYLLAIKKDGNIKFYLSDQRNAKPRELTEKYPVIQPKRLKDIFQDPQNQITTYAFLAGIVLAFGQLHQFGSERGMRSCFLEFLLQKFSGSPDFELIQEIYNSAKGLICADYLPENYEPENYGGKGKILPGCPIATDGPEPDPFKVLVEFGTDTLRKWFQQLVQDPYNYDACRAILNPNSTTNP